MFETLLNTEYRHPEHLDYFFFMYGDTFKFFNTHTTGVKDSRASYSVIGRGNATSIG